MMWTSRLDTEISEIRLLVSIFLIEIRMNFNNSSLTYRRKGIKADLESKRSNLTQGERERESVATLVFYYKSDHFTEQANIYEYVATNERNNHRSHSLFEVSDGKLSAIGSRRNCQGPPERALGPQS